MNEKHLEKLQEWYEDYLKEYSILFEDESMTLYLVKIEKNKYVKEDSIDLIRVFSFGSDAHLSVDKQLSYNFENICEMFKIANNKIKYLT